MDVEIPVLTGYLNVPNQSSFSLNRISKKKPCNRYCLLFKSSRHGIERLEICESKEDKNPKIITLENCVKITQEPSPANLIYIVKKTGTLTLNALTDEELKEWINALQTVAFRDKSCEIGPHVAIEEDNDLYSSCGDGDGLFKIRLIPSDTSIRCNIEPKTYLLHLKETELQLKSEDLAVIVANWPYRFIRKYGYRDGKFTFEAGRKCTTGEGVFTLDHSKPQEIFRFMSAKMKSMKKLISSDSLNSIDCGENQLNIAASMEAGSRSPLPPSPSNQHTGDFEINSTQSCISLRGFLSSSDSLNNCLANAATSSAPLPSIKNIPNKPPRKLPSPLEKLTSSPPTSKANSQTTLELKCRGQLNCEKLKKFQNYEPVSITMSVDPNKAIGSTVMLKHKSADDFRESNTPPDLPIRNESSKTANPTSERDYECIENITDAWKTLGVGDVKHTERLAAISNEDFVGQRLVSQREKVPLKEVLSTIKTQKIIDIDIGEGGGNSLSSVINDSTYDRLDFLSPNNKSSSGYKTIVAVSSPTNRLCYSPSPPNDYELIASPDIQSCRKADDSHLGYGILRKTTTTMINSTTSTVSKNNPVNVQSNSPAAEQALVTTPATRSTITKAGDSGLDHRSYNGLDYTIVSKPKRV